MPAIPDDTTIALAARNLIVRETGECRIPLIVLLHAIQEAERVRKLLQD